MRISLIILALGFVWLPTFTTGQEFDPNPSFFDAQPKPQPKEQLKPIAPAPEIIGKIELKDVFKEYPIWLMIQPQGVRFLQSDEEIAVHQNSIPHHAFLVGCHEAEFKAVSDAEDRSFLLSCQDFALLGSYGTKQFAEIKGMSLAYSTKTNQLQLQGDKDAPVEARLNHPDTETLMQAEVINLNLQGTLKQVKVMRAISKEQITVSVPEKSTYQLSAKNITSLEINTNAETENSDAPMWDPRAIKPRNDTNNIPFYDNPSSEKKSGIEEQKIKDNLKPNALNTDENPFAPVKKKSDSFFD